MDNKLRQLANDRDYIRPPYTSVFLTTIKIDCLYKIEGAKFLIAGNFDKFYYIPGTTNILETVRLLELAIRLRKRTARLALSYKIGTSNDTNIRERISAKHSNLNIVGSDDDDEAI